MHFMNHYSLCLSNYFVFKLVPNDCSMRFTSHHFSVSLYFKSITALLSANDLISVSVLVHF